MIAGRVRPVALLVGVLVLLVLVLGMVLYLSDRNSNEQISSWKSTAAMLQTAVRNQEVSAAVWQTRVSQLQITVAGLQNKPTAQRTPQLQSDGTHSYIATFQIGRYSYVLFMQWDESGGFMHGGQLLTADNYTPRAALQFTITGVDNGGSYGFTATSGSAVTTFTGAVRADGDFSVTGLPWSFFRGFVGGTFSQTLHPGTMQDYRSAVSNLGSPPS